ncbi:KpsF/GutQ family sugar-phosphate isomerase [Rhodobacteraceae bacterium MCCB 386]|nr:KpsF/GutQ family sugar-phosphate isomerase [Roseitranquillus sediminis]
MKDDTARADDLVALCRAAVEGEAAALTAYAAEMGPEVAEALALLSAATAPVVVSGVGKSGHVARKIASTFSSIGKPALFVHAAEASHGDLGLIAPGSVVLILSNSGETPELSDLMHYCEAHDVPTVALTARPDSTLGRKARVTLAYGPVTEVCLIGLAPTTSTTLQMAVGDALAVGLTRIMGTVPDDFRRYHPGGKLGARLTRVAAVMHTGDGLPLVAPDTPMAEVVVEMSRKSLGVAILSEAGEVGGIITEGDLRRNLDRLWDARARDVATPRPVTVGPDMLVHEAVDLMTARAITSLIVAEDGRLAGLVHVHDCLRLL